MVTDLCHVPLSIGKFSEDYVACDVVDMDNCHILLGRPCQHDVDATHKGKKNIYMFSWKGKRVALKPSAPIRKSIKERSPNLSICNQGRSRFWEQTFPQAKFANDSSVQGSIDRNSRSSSFEKGGTETKRQNKKSRFNSGPHAGLGRPLV